MWWESEDSVSSQASLVLQLHASFSAMQHITYSDVHNHLHPLLQLQKHSCRDNKCMHCTELNTWQTHNHIMGQVLCRTTCDQADWITFNFLQFRHHPSSPLVTRPPHAIAIKLYWRCNLHRFHSSRLHRLFGHDPDYSGGERCNQLGR